MKAGIFGGTFDPPHMGHLILAAEACAQLGLDEVHWVLTPVSPFKQGQAISPTSFRIDLLRAAIAGNPQFVLSRIDLDRPPPHYAADSVELLRDVHPEIEWFYLMGSDSLRDLPAWHEPRRLLAACTGLGVLRRPGTQIDVEALECRLPGLREKLRWVDAPLIDISASHIREMIRQGGPYRYYLPPAVYALIQKQEK